MDGLAIYVFLSALILQGPAPPGFGQLDGGVRGKPRVGRIGWTGLLSPLAARFWREGCAHTQKGAARSDRGLFRGGFLG